MIVDHQELARGKRSRSVAREGLDFDGPLGKLLGYARQFVLRHREDDGDGIELRNHDDAGRVIGMHQIPGIDLTYARDAVDGRPYSRIIELQARVLELRLIGLHCSVGLIDHRGLIVDLLLRHQVFLPQRLVPLEIELCVALLSAVFGERGLGLVQLNGERSRVDFER